MAESSKGIWFLLGLTVGALVGVLYAPQSGEETRDLLSRKADEGRDLVSRKASDLREQAGSFREQATNIADRGKQTVTRQLDQFQAAVEAGKQAYRESAGLDKPEASRL